MIYVGSLAGLLPGGPGHSHQSVRDISALGAMPGHGAGRAVLRGRGRARAIAWAVARGAGAASTSGWSRCRGSSASSRRPRARSCPGAARSLREGGDALIVDHRPGDGSQAWAAAERLAEQGVDAGVVALPWLRGVDGEWLREVAGGAPVFCIDNHYLERRPGRRGAAPPASR